MATVASNTHHTQPDAARTPGAGGAGGSLLDTLAREGAQRMLAAALIAEADDYVQARTAHLDQDGHRLVVRNGYHHQRSVTTAAGAVQVRAPRVNDKRTDPTTGQRMQFTSAILPRWARRSPSVNEVLPLLYLHGLSTSDMVPALEGFFGTDANLSAPVIARLSKTWQEDLVAFNNRDLSGTDFVYVWADGIHVNIRLDTERLCLLVLIGVRADGRKELITLADGQRESTGSWADLLREAKRRGMRAPVLAIGDGALGFWAALGEVFPDTRTQRCWFHKIANVLSALPKSAHPGAKRYLAEIYNAQDRAHAEEAARAFAAEYGTRWPKAAAKIIDDLQELLAFYDYPGEHWVHLRTTNPIESTFATVRHRTKVTKGPGSKAAGLAMAFKLMEAAQGRWRAVTAPHLVALVREGVVFRAGRRVERPGSGGGPEADGALPAAA